MNLQMSVCIHVSYILLEVLLFCMPVADTEGVPLSLNTIHNVDVEKDSSDFSLVIHKTND